MPANAFCSPGVQLNVALIRCLISAKHRENRNYIREQHKNHQNNSKRYQNLKNEEKLNKKYWPLYLAVAFTMMRLEVGEHFPQPTRGPARLFFLKCHRLCIKTKCEWIKRQQ